MADLRNEIIRNIDNYFKEKWLSKICQECGSVFYSKDSIRETCGSQNCENINKKNNSRNAKENKKNITFNSLPELNSYVEGILKNIGFSKRNAIGIVRQIPKSPKNMEIVDTLFVVAGVQALEEVINGKFTPKPTSPLFISQPVVRLTSIEKVGKVDGLLTSFVNICTEQINPQPKDFPFHLQSWLTVLECLGISNEKITLKVLETPANLGTKKPPGIFVRFNYNGLEIGDAGYIYDIPHMSGESVDLIDVGFGLERIGWLVNETPSFFDMVGPLLESSLEKYVLIDHLRTLTLLFGSGIRSSKNLHGYRIRQLVSNLLNTEPLSINVHSLIPYYYLFWRNFTALPVPASEVKARLLQEQNDCLNREILKIINLKKKEVDVSIPTSDFVNKLVEGKYGRTIEIYEFNKLIAKRFKQLKTKD